MQKRDLHHTIRHFRESAGLTVADVTESLVLADGWVDAWEDGLLEPPLVILSQLVALCGVDLGTFFAQVDLGEAALTFERHLVASGDEGSLRLTFPMGSHKATVLWRDAALSDAETLLALMRARLSDAKPRAKSRAVIDTFREACRLWPNVNPSDIWYFLISHAYQDQYNHPVSEAGRDLSQSWKRTGGWAFERIIRDHYDGFLREHDVWLEIPAGDRKRALLEPMNLTNFTEALEKADVLAVGATDGAEHCFGVIHAKASLAERRTDDAPLSRELLQRGYVSPLVTMDCKAAPALEPVNRGEFGADQGSEKVSQKRLNIEQHNIFDAAFSFNSNTIPTPSGAPAAARIHVIDFNNPDDAFGQHVVNKWLARHGKRLR